MNISVSVIIPIYNGESFLNQLLTIIESINEFMGSEVEFVIVDNNSNDNSFARLKIFKEHFQGRLILLKDERQGAAYARNYGVAQSSGYWLQFLDVDDRITAQKISRQIDVSNGCEWVIGAYRHEFIDGRKLDVFPSKDPWIGLFNGYRTGHTISNLVTRKAFDRVGRWNEMLKCNQDPELHFRLLKKGVSYSICGDVDSFYVHHTGERITSSYAIERAQNHAQMLSDAIEFLGVNKKEYFKVNKMKLVPGLVNSLRLFARFNKVEAIKMMNVCKSYYDNY